MRNDGNALFLILIAVALFAALSYAITQSGRGGGSIDRETAALEAAQLTQAVSQFVIDVKKFQITSGFVSTALVFCNPPGASCNIGGTYDNRCTTGSDCVFAPEGGNISIDALIAFANKYRMDIVWETVNNYGGHGSSAGDMAVYVGEYDGDVGDGLPDEQCAALNNGLGLGSTIPAYTTIAGLPPTVSSFSGEFEHCQATGGYNYYLTVMYPY